MNAKIRMNLLAARCGASGKNVRPSLDGRGLRVKYPALVLITPTFDSSPLKGEALWKEVFPGEQ
jgi:hypothetical protein